MTDPEKKNTVRRSPDAVPVPGRGRGGGRPAKYFPDDHPAVIACAKAKAAVGGPKALGYRIGIRSQACSNWDVVPADRVLEIERITGISRHELRPDVFGPPDERPLVDHDLKDAAELSAVDRLAGRTAPKVEAAE